MAPSAGRSYPSRQPKFGRFSYGLCNPVRQLRIVGGMMCAFRLRQFQSNTSRAALASIEPFNFVRKIAGEK
jgi:hypothetical protein